LLQSGQAVFIDCKLILFEQVVHMASETDRTLSVPEAGKRYFGLGRDGSYRAAERGDIPVIRIGRLLRVPVRAMERLLETAGRHDGAHQRELET
jgi:hypothetical protein